MGWSNDVWARLSRIGLNNFDLTDIVTYEFKTAEEAHRHERSFQHKLYGMNRKDTHRFPGDGKTEWYAVESLSIIDALMTASKPFLQVLRSPVLLSSSSLWPHRTDLIRIRTDVDSLVIAVEAFNEFIDNAAISNPHMRISYLPGHKIYFQACDSFFTKSIGMMMRAQPTYLISGRLTDSYIYEPTQLVISVEKKVDRNNFFLHLSQVIVKEKCISTAHNVLIEFNNRFPELDCIALYQCD